MSDLQRKNNSSSQVSSKISEEIQMHQILIKTENKERDLGRNLMLIAFSTIGALVISLIFNFVLFYQQPGDRYFTVDENLRVVQITPLNEPFISNSALINWATEVTSSSFTLSFADWRQSLVNVSDNYEQNAFDAFVQSYKNSGNLKLIIEKRLNSIVNLDGPATITAQGLSPVNGRYTWVVQIPIMINYESSNGVEVTQKLLATATVQRVSTLETPRGIKIKLLISEPRN